MDHKEHFDFWYAVNNTEVVQPPRQNLETFGTTMLHYHLVSELMDSVDKVRVREGKIEAARPQIITPGDMGGLPLEGFSDEESSNYVNWMKNNAQHLRVLQYGFQIKKQDIKSYIVSEPTAQVLENVKAAVDRANEPLSAIILGVDEPWEVCLLKLITDVVEQSVSQNVQDFQGRNMLPRGPEAIHKEIDDDFLAASRDPGRMAYLHKKLMRLGLFKEYEDRFYALVRSQGGS